MLKLQVVGKRGAEENKIIATISERDIDKYDSRLYDIIPMRQYKQQTNEVPSSIIKAREKSGKVIDFPIFYLDDLSKLYISKTGHLVVK